jgi:hypothetical protein
MMFSYQIESVAPEVERAEPGRVRLCPVQDVTVTAGGSAEWLIEQAGRFNGPFSSYIVQPKRLTCRVAFTSRQGLALASKPLLAAPGHVLDVGTIGEWHRARSI